MIYVNIPDSEYYDDAHILLKSFYPEQEITAKKCEDIELEIKMDTPVDDGRSRRELHDEFKEKLYLRLVQETGRTLPWGNVTGVRPSKLVMNMLADHVPEADIREYYRTNHFVSHDKIDLAVKVAERELEILNRLDFRSGYSLYIGIPFCPTTCLYCSFTSYPLAMWKSEVDTYLDALLKELGFIANLMSGKRLDTIYLGGGTPTTLTPSQLDRLLGFVEEHFDLDSTYEITVEAGRPDSITMEKLLVLKSHKVDRISINPQTMNQVTLDIIGRRHTVGQVTDAYEMSRECGFDNVNMDMILGLPGEDKDMVENTLEQIAKLKPSSLTVHSLAIKRAAALKIWKEEYKDVKLFITDEIVEMTASYAKKLSLEPYYMYRQKNITGNFENVGYAVPGKECIYNILIMEEKQTIIAAGAGASSKIVFPGKDGVGDRIERIENVKDVRNYITRIDEMIQRKADFFKQAY